jgi:ATP-dependent Clp protease protease subunit
MAETPTPPATQAPVQAPQETVYATLTGLVDAQMTQRGFTNGAIAVNNGVKQLHLLIQSTGGTVGEGVGIYNYLRNLPLEVTTYNGGNVLSIAVIVYLAGKTRKTSETAAFMIHKSAFTFNAPATAERLKIGAEGLVVEDARSEAVLRRHITLPDEKWRIHERGDLYLTAEEAVKFGLAHSVGDFAPPPGSKLFTI